MLVIALLLIVLIVIGGYTMATLKDAQAQLALLQTTAATAITLLQELKSNQADPAEVQTLVDGLASVNTSLTDAITAAGATETPPSDTPQP